MQVASIDQLAVHFALESNLLHTESDEAQRQLAREKGDGNTHAHSADTLPFELKTCSTYKLYM